MTERDDRPRVVSLAPGANDPGQPAPLPPGKLEVVVTSLEMRSRPARPPLPPPALPLAVLRADPPTVAYYRFLYETIGGPWLWYERRLLDDQALRAIIEDPQVEVYVLYLRGSPAGYTELDRRRPGEVELAYLGLMPELTGRGLGPYLLDWAIETAWRSRPERVWVHTCNLDHPAALGLYQRAGFVPYRRERTLIDDPRREGAMPPGREFRAPAPR